MVWYMTWEPLAVLSQRTGGSWGDVGQSLGKVLGEAFGGGIQQTPINVSWRGLGEAPSLLQDTPLVDSKGKPNEALCTWRGMLSSRAEGQIAATQHSRAALSYVKQSPFWLSRTWSSENWSCLWRLHPSAFSPHSSPQVPWHPLASLNLLVKTINTKN